MARQDRIGTLATTVATLNGYTRVSFHSTVVVAFDDAEVWLDSGGWKTPTTKTRINQAANQFDLGFHVYQARGNWFIVTRLPNGEWDHDNPIPFTDGMRLGRSSERSVFA